MPSFDIVSQVDWHEVSNALDQANREINTRYDFKGSGARIESNELQLVIHADDEYQIGQIRDILELRLTRRGVDIRSLEFGEIREAGSKAQQEVMVRSGIDSNFARSLVKRIKNSKLKVQTAVQGDQLRVTGKKRDDLQSVIALLDKEDKTIPLQYINFRD